MIIQIRDTQFGHFVRLLSKNKYLQYPDESDSYLLKKLLQQETFSLNTPESAQLEPSEKSEEVGNTGETGQKVLAEAQAADDVETQPSAFKLVDWYSPNDSEVSSTICLSVERVSKPTQNPRNWSSKWKLFITSQICLMNFSVYIASSIYVPGESGVRQDFGVSETAATLGLSMYSL